MIQNNNDYIYKITFYWFYILDKEMSYTFSYLYVDIYELFFLQLNLKQTSWVFKDVVPI